MNENLHIADIINFKLFSKETCEKIIDRYSDSQDWVFTKIGRHSQMVKDEEVRRSSIISLSSDKSFLGSFMSDMSEAIVAANSQFWNFDITNRMEIQIMKYNPGDHYEGWHIDIGNTPKAASRKISFVIQLSCPDEYSGGDLTIASMEENPSIKSQGSATMFPSFISHCVKSVTNGTRYCLVGWIHGPSFK
jgi:PKHD-type hydroxylase